MRVERFGVEGWLITERADAQKEEIDMNTDEARQRMLERHRSAWRHDDTEERADGADKWTSGTPEDARARMLERNRRAWRGGRYDT